MGKSKKKTDGDMKKNGDRVSKWKQVFNRENSFYDEVSYVFCRYGRFRRFVRQIISSLDIRIRLRILTILSIGCVKY